MKSTKFRCATESYTGGRYAGETVREHHPQQLNIILTTAVSTPEPCVNLDFFKIFKSFQFVSVHFRGEGRGVHVENRFRVEEEAFSTFR